MDDSFIGLETPVVGVHLDEPLLTADQVARLLAIPRRRYTSTRGGGTAAAVDRRRASPARSTAATRGVADDVRDS
jgi:hypothetical protein